MHSIFRTVKQCVCYTELVETRLMGSRRGKITGISIQPYPLPNYQQIMYIFIYNIYLILVLSNCIYLTLHFFKLLYCNEEFFSPEILLNISGERWSVKNEQCCKSSVHLAWVGGRRKKGRTRQGIGIPSAPRGTCAAAGQKWKRAVPSCLDVRARE